jgi:hypothetical protein
MINIILKVQIFFRAELTPDELHREMIASILK